MADIHFPDKKTIVLVAKRTPLVVATNLIAAAIARSSETAKDNSEDTLIEEVEDEDIDASEIIGGDVDDEKDT